MHQQQSSNQLQQSQLSKDQDDYRSPYSALPVHMRQMQGLNQSQPNIWNGKQTEQQQVGNRNISERNSNEPTRTVQQRAASQPQLNVSAYERHGSQTLLDQAENRNSVGNMDIVTDSDDGGFATRATRRPQTIYQVPLHNGQHNHQQSIKRNSPLVLQGLNQNQSNGTSNYSQQYISPYQNSHMNGQHFNGSANIQHTAVMQNGAHSHMMTSESTYSTIQSKNEQDLGTPTLLQSRQDAQRASFQNRMQEQKTLMQQQSTQALQNHQSQNSPLPTQAQQKPPVMQRMEMRQISNQDLIKQVPGSANSSDYDKSGNQSSNVDSGRGSAAYSSGRKAQLDTESSDSPMRVGTKNDDSEWVDIVDAELRHILEPGMQGLSLRPDSTVSDSVSSMSPPLPPLSPDGSSYKPPKSSKEKLEYGTDSYNRPGRALGPIGPSRAGWPGSGLHKQAHGRSSGKKHEQAMLKRHCKF